MPFSPQSRRVARMRAAQFLYGLDFTGYAWRAAIDDFWEDTPAKPAVRQYANQLIEGVMARREELDEAIGSAIENWEPGRISPLLRNVIRLALYEMRYGDNVPPGVAINEAIEVTKRFGDEEGAGFVNGVLDRLKVPS